MRDDFKSCLHCGTPFRTSNARTDFCCSGCEYVRGLILEKGLGQFYDLKTEPVPPVTSLVFQQRDYRWLEALVQLSEASDSDVAELRLDLQGVSCVGCVWLIEKLFSRRPGAIAVEVNSGLGEILLRWEKGRGEVLSFASEILALGYLLGPLGKSSPAESQKLIGRIGLCAAFMMNSMLFGFPDYLGMEASFEYSRLFHQLLVGFSTLSYLVGGSYFITRSWRSLRHGILHLDLPISIGITAAYLGSLYAWWHGEKQFLYFEFVSTFIFLMLVGRWLQHKALESNRHRLLESGAGIPAVTELQTGAQISAEAIRRGIVYRGVAGQIIPVRSMLLLNETSIGLDWISGEAGAKVVRAGELIPSGAILLGQHEVSLKAEEDWEDSALASLVKVIPRDPFRNPAVEQFIRAYLLIVLGIALVGGCYWQWSGGDWFRTLQVVTSILVVSCPCATGIALPMIDDLLVRRLKSIGLFVREASLWSRLPRVRKILFDKTGTLTFETLLLREPNLLRELPQKTRETLLDLVWENWHPVSICLRAELLAAGTRRAQAAPLLVKEFPGFGLEFISPEGRWRLGRARWAMSENSCAPLDADAVLSYNFAPVATFNFIEAIRDDVLVEVDVLQKMRLEIYLLSGDRREKVEAIAKQLNLSATHALAEMTPQQKSDQVKLLNRQDTLMIGDGANDSLAFNASWCTGTPAADRGVLERKADFYFLGRGLSGIRQLFLASIARQKTIRRVFSFTIFYNATVVVVSLLGNMLPVMAAILMPLSSLISLGLVFLSLPKFERLAIAES